MEVNEQGLKDNEPNTGEGGEFDFLKDAISGNSHNVTNEQIEEAEVIPEEKIYHILEDGTKCEIINGRYLDPTVNRWKFAPGNKIASKNLGVLKPREQQLSILNAKSKINWKEIGNYIDNKGMERFITEMESLDGRDYITAYLGLLPYIKPKIANVEIKPDKDLKGIAKKGHTITVRDMRDNSEKVMDAITHKPIKPENDGK